MSQRMVYGHNVQLMYVAILDWRKQDMFGDIPHPSPEQDQFIGEQMFIFAQELKFAKPSQLREWYEMYRSMN